MELVNKVRKTIAQHSMISTGDRVLIGLSGGPDSVCLAVILDKLKEDFNLSLGALYINHNLRPDEVDREITFCKKLCNELDMELYVRSVDVKKHAKGRGLNIQEAARELRYRKFEEVAGEMNAESIALGHNADDQAETVFMRLLRGSGRRGLSGIPPVRGRIIRPLIETERSEIEEFLAGEIHALPLHAGRPYMMDSSNLRDDYFRNWIRSSLVAEMKKNNPAVVRDICRAANIFREEDDYLEIIVTKTLMRLISRKSSNTIELFVTPLETVERPILRRVLRRAIEATEGLRGISFMNIEDIIALVQKGKAGDRLCLPRGIRVVKEYSILKITSGPPVKIAEYEVHPPCRTQIEGSDIMVTASLEKKGERSGDGRTEVLLDAGNMDFPLKIRARVAGDFFYPLGFGKRKKLQDYFVDEKIPRDERDRVPIVLSGNDIIWVAGYRADERFKVTDRTEKVLRLAVSKR